MGRKRFSTATLNSTETSASSPQATDPTLPPPPSSIPSTFSDSLPLPTLMVFDLDYTLWPFWVDTHVSAPLKPANKPSASLNTVMLDRFGEPFTFYPEVPGLLYEMRRRGIVMGLASRTCTPDLAAVMLRGISIPVPTHYSNNSATSKDNGETEEAKPTRALDFFAYREMYPGSKTRHFRAIQQATRKLKLANRQPVDPKQGVTFDEMLFFDDESRNRDVERELGVTFWLVRDGVTKDEVDKGVWEWRKRKGITKSDLGKSKAGEATMNGDGAATELD